MLITLANLFLSDDPNASIDQPFVASRNLKEKTPVNTFESSFLNFVCQSSDNILQTTHDGKRSAVSCKLETVSMSKVITPVKQVESTTITPIVSKIKLELSERKDIIGDISDIINIDSSNSSSSNSNDWNTNGGTSFSDAYFKFISESSVDACEDDDSKEANVTASLARRHCAQEDASGPSLADGLYTKGSSLADGVDTQGSSLADGFGAEDASIAAEVCPPPVGIDDPDLQQSHFCPPTHQDASALTWSGETLQDPLALIQKPIVISVDDSDDESLSRPVSEPSDRTGLVKSLDITACPTDGSGGVAGSPGKNEFTGFQSIPAVHPLLVSFLMTAKCQSLTSVGDAANNGTLSIFNKSTYSSSSVSGGVARYRSSRTKPPVLQTSLARARLQRKEALKTYDQITCVRLVEADSDTSSVESAAYKARKRKLSPSKSPRKRVRPRSSSAIPKVKIVSELSESNANTRLKVAQVNIKLWTKAHVDKVLSESCSNSSADESLLQKTIPSKNDPKLKLDASVLVERVDLARVKRKFGVTLSDSYLYPPAN